MQIVFFIKKKIVFFINFNANSLYLVNTLSILRKVSLLLNYMSMLISLTNFFVVV